MTGAAHVIWDNLTRRDIVVLRPEQQLVMRCLHCGDRYVAVLPAPMSFVSGILGLYVKEHEGCEPREPVP
jgi:hypothetical protein